ncbi:MAG: transcriptional regulator, partial [Deltaproteobacteria bacterium]|nr:transcriptional regulator [Deltaproteobacteria bacterium]
SLRMHGQTAGQYYHGYVGMNGRLDALQAVVLLKKLPHLDAWAAKRRKNAALYADMFKAAGLEDNLTLPHTQQDNTHVFNQFVIRTTRRDELKQHLLNNNIGCAIYYPLPLHLQDCFSFLNYKEGAFPESEKAAAETLALPVYPELSQEQIGYVVETIKEFYTV